MATGDAKWGPACVGVYTWGTSHHRGACVLACRQAQRVRRNVLTHAHARASASLLLPLLVPRLAAPPPTVVLATAGYDHTIRFWEATTGVCYRTVQYPDSQVNRLAITPDKSLLAAAGNPNVRLFDVVSSAPQPVRVLEGHTGNVTSVGFEQDARWIYTGSEDGTVRLWDLRAPGCQREFVCRAAVNDVELHPNQGELISGDGAGNIRVWDLAQNACSCELVPEVDVPVSSVTVAADGSLVVAANHRGTCYVWQLSKGGGGEGSAPGGAPTTAAFDPLHKLQAHGPGSVGAPPDAGPAYVLKCLLSPDVRLLATTSSDKTVKLWSLDNYSFDLTMTLTGHTRWVWDCAFSVDACYLVTASSDTSARLWDLSGDMAEAIKVYSGHHKAVTCCALNDSS